MKLSVKLDIVTIVYKPTNAEIFKCVQFNQSEDDTISNIPNKIDHNFTPSPEHLEELEQSMVMYDGELNIEGYEDLYRFLSNVEGHDFFDVNYSSQTVEF